MGWEVGGFDPLSPPLPSKALVLLTMQIASLIIITSNVLPFSLCNIECSPTKLNSDQVSERCNSFWMGKDLPVNFYNLRTQWRVEKNIKHCYQSFICKQGNTKIIKFLEQTYHVVLPWLNFPPFKQ